MKRAAAMMLSLIFLLAAGAAMAENTISPEELAERIDNSLYLNLFDVRSGEEYAAGHLPTSVSFPLDTLHDEIKQILDGGYSYMSAEIIVYGNTEEQGVQAEKILKDLGFTNVRYLAGMNVWTGKTVTLEEEYRPLGGLDTTDIYGRAVDETLLQGYRLTMVNVWATYCNPCINEMADLGRLAEDMKAEGVQIVGLLSDATDASLSSVEYKVNLAREIAEATGASYPHLLPSKKLYRKVISGISAVPTTFFVDETGAIVGGPYVGARNYSAWKQIIENELAKLP